MKSTVGNLSFLFQDGLERYNQRFSEIKERPSAHVISKNGEITESQCGMEMHGTMLSVQPPLSYWETRIVWLAMQLVRQLRPSGYALLLLQWMLS